MFRVFFAILHTIKWKWRFCCNKKYKIQEYNLEAAFKKLKKEARTGGDSTDDEDMAKQAEELFNKHSKAITSHASVRFHDVDTYEGRQEAAMAYAHDNMNKDTDEGSEED